MAAAMRIYTNLRDEVEAYLGTFSDCYDIGGIVDHLKGMGAESIDDLTQDDFTEVLEMFDMGGAEG